MRYFALPAAALLAACAADTFATNDGGSEAGTDAGGVPDAVQTDGPTCMPAPMPCPPNGTCTNFDTNAYGGFLVIPDPSGSVTIGSDKHVSCPHAMLASIGAVPASASTYRAAIGTTVTGLNLAQAHARIIADLWLPESPSGDFVVLALRANADASSVVDVEYHASDQTWYLVDKRTDKQESFAPQTGTWNHFILDVNFASDQNIAQASLTYDAQQGGTPNKVGPIDDPNVASSIVTQLSAQIGIETATTNAPLNVYADDVEFDGP